MYLSKSPDELVPLLEQAVMNGDVAEAERLLKIAEGNGTQPLSLLLTNLLHLSVEWSRVEIAELLIQHGAAVDGRDRDGDTPLMHAVRDCQMHLPMVEFLVQAGADADAENNGYRVIDYAESADVPEHIRNKALEMLWRAPRFDRTKPKKDKKNSRSPRQ